MMTELASWSDVLRYLTISRSRYQLTSSAALVEYESGGRRWRVFLRPVLSSPAPGASKWLAMSINLSSGNELDLRAALMANLFLPIGGLCLIGDRAALHLTLPLGGLLVTHLDEAMSSLVRVAHEVYQPAHPQGGAFGYLFR